MKPVWWIIAIVAGVALAGAWHFWEQREKAAAAAPAGLASPASARVDAAPTVAAIPAAHAEISVAPPPPVTEEQVAQWITDVDSTDAARRTVAIRALAQAPRAQALPVLQRLVLNADPVDRPLALQSLRDLALQQGDADNGIRQAIRQVIYHGDDEQLAAGAQEALDAVERSQQR
ncbi:MAG TPA: hypothetical protein VM146_08500 [Steroidobacteraceae bacterium]|nr:hypothetical protein [Steroidobacteraceae bacterium]